MKKAVCIILTVAQILMLAACQSTTLPTESTNPPAGSTAPPNTTQPDTTSAPGSSTDIPLPPKEIVDSITYVKFGLDYMPVSYVVGGEQKLTGFGGEYFDGESLTGIPSRIKDKTMPKAEGLNKVDTKEMFADQVSYSSWVELMGKVYAVGVFDAIASSGDWDLFPVKVRYETYTVENQPDRKEWTDYFEKEIAAQLGNAPLIFTDAWIFDWNGDGKESALVNASNIIWHSEDKKDSATPSPPPADNTGGYQMSALFVDGNEPVPQNGFGYSIPKEPLNGENGISQSYLPFQDDTEEWYENCFSVIQFDTQGNLMECPVFTQGEFGWISRTIMLLSDVDGDGKPELLTLQTSIYAPVIVYKLIDGKLQEIFRAHTSA